MYVGWSRIIIIYFANAAVTGIWQRHPSSTIDSVVHYKPYSEDNKQWCMQASGGAGSRMADILAGVLQVPDIMQALHGQSIADFLSSMGMEYAPAQGEGLITVCNNDKLVGLQ